MISRVITAAILLTSLLCSRLVYGQTPVDLAIPVNHTGTGVAIGYVNENPNPVFNVWLFNAKDQPSLQEQQGDFRRAFWHSETISAGMTQDWMYDPNGSVIPTNLYPSYVTRGGISAPSWTDAVVAEYNPNRYAGRIPSASNWYWTDGTPNPNPEVWRTHPVTCLASDRPSADPVAQTIVAGLDRIHDNDDELHYFERSADGGLRWNRVLSDGSIPSHKAITDIALQGGDIFDPLRRCVAVTTSTLDVVQPGELPLLSGHVVNDNMTYVTHRWNWDMPLWQAVQISDHELLNVQLTSIELATFAGGHDVYAVALDARTEEFVTFCGRFNTQNQFTWTPMIPTVSNPPDGTIPYDLEFGPGVNGGFSLIASTSTGLYYSPGPVPGREWFPVVNSSPTGVKLTPELRKMSLETIGNTCSIALAGWYASYVGTVSNANGQWIFDLREVDYDPTILNIYQNRNQAWCCLSLPDFSDYALVDHSTDEYFPNDSAVVVQITSLDQSPRTVFLGYQDHNTHPFMRMNLGTGRPWVVYNREGITGPMVKTERVFAPNAPAEWDSVALFDDANGVPASISDVSSSPAGDFILFDNRLIQNGHSNQLWHKLTNENWAPANCNGLEPDMLHGYLASDQSVLYYLFPAPNTNGFLYRSSNFGSSFSEITPTAILSDWTSIHFNSMSKGFSSDIPLYFGGKNSNQVTGRILRMAGNGLNSSDWISWNCNSGVIDKIVADPYESNLIWAAKHDAMNGASMSLLNYRTISVPGGAFGENKWWSLSDVGYAIRDIQINALTLNERVLNLTLKTPDSNAVGVDHTVCKQWRFNVAGLNVPLPALVSGTWIIADDVTIPTTQSVAIQAGTTLSFAPGAKLIVNGYLNAQGISGNEVVFQKIQTEDPSEPWDGIEVNGHANLSYCNISGAITGLSLNQPKDSVSVTNCMITDNGTGIYAYTRQKAINNHIAISNCTVAHNSNNGLQLFATSNLTLTENMITLNGGSGILMTNGTATLRENSIHKNTAYGLECGGSSPILYCNDFYNNYAGEIMLYKFSYPVLWSPNGTDGGTNKFLNEHVTLITMYDSYPILTKGKNNFFVSATGYFMADMSEKPVQHDLSGNYWNPSLAMNLLYPSDPKFWTWGTVDYSVNLCGGSRGSGGLINTALFEQGFTAESSSDLALAQIYYSEVLSDHSDSSLYAAAAARKLELQRQSDTSCVDLRGLFTTLAAGNPQDTIFAETLQDLATRSLVEDHFYTPALTTYEQVMSDPPNPIDSSYAALDHAVTLYREQNEDTTESGLDSAPLVIAMSSISDLIKGITNKLPPAPQTLHQGYVELPTNYVLEQNFPNPFNAITQIRYFLPEANHVKLDLFNVVGQHITSLVATEQNPGYHTVIWNGADAASGVYFYRMEAGNQVLTHKMVLLK